MAALGQFMRDVAWTGTIVEGGMGPGTPAMTAIGRGRHTSIQDGRWIVGSYEQQQRLLDGTFVLTWQLHWVAGWDPTAGEYRATLADNYGHADVMRGQIEGDRLTFTTFGDRPVQLRLIWDVSDPANMTWRNEASVRRPGMVVDRGVPAHTRPRLGMTLDRLTGLDVTHLVADEVGWPGHIGAIAVLDGAGLIDDDGMVRVDHVRAAVARRLHLVPRFRQLIQSPRWGLGAPLWVDAPTVDLTYHVRELTLPDGASEDQLLHAVEALRRRAFDTSRPLWELWLMPGLSHARVGAFIKLHHAVADGVAGVALLGSLLAPESALGADHAQAWLPHRAPTTRDLLRDNIQRTARRLPKAASALAHPRRVVARWRAMWPAIREILGEGGAAPRTSLNRPIGPGRRMALVRRSLGDTKDIAHAAGATVNDVILAVVAGGLRDVLQARGEPVDDLVLRISVPVSLHRRTQVAHGNVDSPMAVPVPVGEPDAALRLRTISADTCCAARGRAHRSSWDCSAPVWLSA